MRYRADPKQISDSIKVVAQESDEARLDEEIRETPGTNDEDVGASEDVIEYESKRSTMYRWAIVIALLVICVVLFVFLKSIRF